MATRSNICVEMEGAVGSFWRCIYVHWDGYPDGLGKKLRENYPSRKAIEELISNGDASVIGKTLEKCEFYHRDNEEDWDDVKPKEFETKQRMEKYTDEEYRYELDLDNQLTCIDPYYGKIEFQVKLCSGGANGVYISGDNEEPEVTYPTIEALTNELRTAPVEATAELMKALQEALQNALK